MPRLHPSFGNRLFTPTSTDAPVSDKYRIAVPHQPTLNSALPPYLSGFKSPLTLPKINNF
jgi:hypothetical protein